MRPAVPKPFGITTDQVKNALGAKYAEEHERIFGEKKQHSPTGMTKIIYRNGQRHEFHTQEELDRFEAEQGAIRMRKIEI